MRKEEDLISTLLQETYGHLSDNSSADEETSLSEHFSNRESTTTEVDCFLEVEVFADFVRFVLTDHYMDIPFELGLIEKYMFNHSSDPRVVPIPDFVLINKFSEALNKKVSWMIYNFETSSIQFLTKEEASNLASHTAKIAA